MTREEKIKRLYAELYSDICEGCDPSEIATLKEMEAGIEAAFEARIISGMTLEKILEEYDGK